MSRPGGDSGDPEPHAFLPRDEFKIVLVVKSLFAPPKTAAKCHVIQMDTGEDAAADAAESGGDMVAAAFGVKEIKRNSEDMVEDAFEGDLEAVKGWLEKGYYIDSEDPRKHTAVSEAACNGATELVVYLLDQGADPNICSDHGRSPLYRAAYNGHNDLVKLLLEKGADPSLKTIEAEGPYDVAKDDETRELIEKFPKEETERMLAERRAFLKKKLEERITTQAEREMYMKGQIKEELVQLAIDGDLDGLTAKLDEIIQEAESTDQRPRGNAEARDERGCTLLHLAVQHNHIGIVKKLLTYWKEVDEDNPFLNKDLGEMSTEGKVWKTNVNCRDAKGWNPAAVATFHDHTNMLNLLLEHNGDPTVKNSYRKSAIDLAQPELDAAKVSAKLEFP